jgi:aromatic ring-cleaving dioxygenase
LPDGNPAVQPTFQKVGDATQSQGNEPSNQIDQTGRTAAEGEDCPNGLSKADLMIRSFFKQEDKLAIAYKGRAKQMSVPDHLQGFHVHIYFDNASQAKAMALHDDMVAKFGAKPSQQQFTGIAGPHPIPQTQVIFRTEAFTAEVVPWLMFNRQGLDILIHPLTDDAFEDHTTHAVWFGKPVELLTDKLDHSPLAIPELMPI